MKKYMVIVVGVVLTLATVDAAAHPLSEEECTEGSMFILEVAQAREKGAEGMVVVLLLLSDFEAMKSLPPHLRWFAQDRNDEDFLVQATAKVFEHPKDPATHKSDFFDRCLLRS